jgi:hypothetical protein
LPNKALDPIVAFFALVGGMYACGTWLGKTLAAILERDRTLWSDWGGIAGGLAGFGLFFGYVLGEVLK